jgi:ElaB/YqjD/DUF883 family membrane-anchored ribosome-binding protein
MDQRTNPIQQDMNEIRRTRAAMAQKLEQLEGRVEDTVEGAKTTVLDIVDNVRDAAEDFIDRAEEFVEHTKQNFDPTYQIQRHPWMMIGGAIVAGYVLGVLESRRPSGPPIQGRLPYYGDSASSSPGSSSEDNIWSGLVEQVQDEVERTKGALLQVGRSLIHDLFEQVLPVLTEGRRRPQVRSTPSYSEPKGTGSGFSRTI